MMTRVHRHGRDGCVMAVSLFPVNSPPGLAGRGLVENQGLTPSHLWDHIPQTCSTDFKEEES